MDSFATTFSDYTRLIKMIAGQFGTNTEVVLHDLTHGYESTIVAIENGHVTGREVGGCGSSLGLNVLREGSGYHDRSGYFTHLPDGRTLRSSTMFLTDNAGKIFGSICINTDITALIGVDDALKTLLPVADSVQPEEEVFVKNVSGLLDHYIAEYEKQHPRENKKPSKDDKLEAVRFFDERGVFLISKAGTRLCKYLGISKGTLYSYLDEVRGTG